MPTAVGIVVLLIKFVSFNNVHASNSFHVYYYTLFRDVCQPLIQKLHKFLRPSLFNREIQPIRPPFRVRTPVKACQLGVTDVASLATVILCPVAEHHSGHFPARSTRVTIVIVEGDFAPNQSAGFSNVDTP
jgi:hypothetical protein